MSKSPLRVVFDTNAFMPEHFDLLANGPLQRLCKSGQIQPVYGHVFLEETLRAYGLEKRRVDLVNRWLPFIASTVDRFCNDFVAIWWEELVRGRGRKTNVFMPTQMQQRVLGHLANVPLDGSWRAFHESKAERDVEARKRLAQRDISKEIRQEVSAWKKDFGYDPRRHGEANFARYVRSELDRAGRGFIESLIPCWNPHAVADRWSRDKDAYPYFTRFVKNMLYISFCAATRPNDKIDMNAQADMDLMTHLLWADALVSNETGFLQGAFEDVWRPQGKVLFTSAQFAAFVEKL